MRYFCLRSDAIEFRWAVPASSDVIHKLNQARGQPLGSSIEPIPLQWIPETSDLPISDYPHLGPLLGCYSEKAVTALRRFLENGGELLSCEGLDMHFAVFNCTTIVSHAFDWDRSIVIGDKTHLSKIERASIRINDVNGAHIFRLAESTTDHFVSEEFRRAAFEAELSGMLFKEVLYSD